MVSVVDSTPQLIKDLLAKDDDITVPPYGTAKVKALIEKIKTENPRSTDETRELDPTQYASLSLPEKFTYNLIHPEIYSQGCSALPMREHEDKRIFGHLPGAFGEYGWSQRQLHFFKDNRDTVAQLMKPLIEKSNNIGSNIKEAIVETYATDLIPYQPAICCFCSGHRLYNRCGKITQCPGV
jgi:hypothetical protein